MGVMVLTGIYGTVMLYLMGFCDNLATTLKSPPVDVMQLFL